MQNVMEQAQALLVKAEHDIRQSATAVAQAAQNLQHTQQEAAEAAEAAETVWKRQLAEREAALKVKQEAYQAEQVPESLFCCLPSSPTLFAVDW